MRLTTQEEYPHGAEGKSVNSLTGCYCRGEYEATAVTEKLAEYENAEEDGLLLKLPYPIGTKKLFYVDRDDVLCLDASEITVSKTDISDIVVYTIDGYDFCYADFGKIVFLTEKEALLKLH